MFTNCGNFFQLLVACNSCERTFFNNHWSGFESHKQDHVRQWVEWQRQWADLGPLWLYRITACTQINQQQQKHAVEHQHSKKRNKWLNPNLKHACRNLDHHWTLNIMWICKLCGRIFSAQGVHCQWLVGLECPNMEQVVKIRWHCVCKLIWPAWRSIFP